MFNRLKRHITLIVFGLTSMASACGDDSDSPAEDAGPGDAGPSGGKGGSSGKGGSGKGGSSGKGGVGGNEAGKGGGGKGGTSASSGTGGTAPTMECTEDPPPSGFKCGDETCEVPEFANNPCVVPCCIKVDGQDKCGAKSTSEMFPAACALPAVPDSQCESVSGMGGDMEGCCNYELGKCGIISTARPGCITMSTFVEIPDKTCSKPDTGEDAGAGEPDAG